VEQDGNARAVYPMPCNDRKLDTHEGHSYNARCFQGTSIKAQNQIIASYGVEEL
jgi:hypothetical protein